jgi:hypothetical protein
MLLAGTGHRPGKLHIGNKTAYDPTVFRRVVDLCLATIHRHQPTAIIAGGALGFDEALAQAALETNVPLTLHLPFEGYDAPWPERARERYAALRQRAAQIVWVTPTAALPHDPRTGQRLPLTPGQVAGLLHTRNRAMVDACDTLAALWDGMPHRGTWAAVRYATERGRPLIQLWGPWTKYAARGWPAR